ncbi:hypothetical protein [Mastigocoleus sp. MO_188.B34]|nr:hypothetical protein [Mastigocoleus sp. MO_188.B34]MDJ0697570.1 hypothetical protein [Mastigocoleus sp. MO_188.B34]
MSNDLEIYGKHAAVLEALALYTHLSFALIIFSDAKIAQKSHFLG